MAKNYSVYLAGPISGLDYEEGQGWRQEATNQLYGLGISAFSPLRNKDYLQNAGDIHGSYEKWPLSSQRGIYARDKFDCHRADLVLVNLLDVGADGSGTQRVSIGSVMEIAWAAQANKPVVLVMGENNIHHHPMLMEACPFVADNLLDAYDMVAAILLPSSTTL